MSARGVDLTTLSTRRFLNVVEVEWFDVLRQVDIEGTNVWYAAIGEFQRILAEPIVLDRQAWGLDSRAEEGLSAMMALAGGPAPLRTVEDPDDRTAPEPDTG